MFRYFRGKFKYMIFQYKCFSQVFLTPTFPGYTIRSIYSITYCMYTGVFGRKFFCFTPYCILLYRYTWQLSYTAMGYDCGSYSHAKFLCNVLRVLQDFHKGIRQEMTELCGWQKEASDWVAIKQSSVSLIGNDLKSWGIQYNHVSKTRS